MRWTLAIIFAVILAGLLLDSLPRRYRDRPCQGRAWHQAFPEASKDDIRSFLVLFSGAFAFRPRHKLKFGPDDQILAIYRAIYPSASTPDALELETLAMEVERSYGIQLDSIWRDDLTLGELFSAARAA